MTTGNILHFIQSTGCFIGQKVHWTKGQKDKRSIGQKDNVIGRKVLNEQTNVIYYVNIRRQLSASVLYQHRVAHNCIHLQRFHSRPHTWMAEPDQLAIAVVPALSVVICASVVFERRVMYIPLLQWKRCWDAAQTNRQLIRVTVGRRRSLRRLRTFNATGGASDIGGVEVVVKVVHAVDSRYSATQHLHRPSKICDWQERQAYHRTDALRRSRPNFSQGWDAGSCTLW